MRDRRENDMKVVILAGGLGSRLSEETTVKPKPMVEIGGKPILWHIMKMYLAHGISEVIVCCGYKGNVIKEYFANYFTNQADVTFDLANNRMEVHRAKVEPWRVTLVDTGANTQTGGRLRRVREHLGNEPFCFTYGDGVSDVNITKLVEFHKSRKRLVTLTAARSPGRFGALLLDEHGTRVATFHEKPKGDGLWINGGFFVVDPKAIDYIAEDSTAWEKGPLDKIAEEGQLSAFTHDGFWQPMDTLRDKVYLEDLWSKGQAPWKMWE